MVDINLIQGDCLEKMKDIPDGSEVHPVGCVLPNTLVHGDCLEVMKYIPDGSVDLVLCDPPYG